MMHRLLNVFVASLLAFSVNVFAEMPVSEAISDDVIQLETEAEALSGAADEMAAEATEATKSVAEQREAFIETLNINTADAELISSMLKGVGKAKAEAIVKYREENGPFKSLEELSQVKGIGKKTIAQNEAVISFE